jgi:hypothetical protein
MVVNLVISMTKEYSQKRFLSMPIKSLFLALFRFCVVRHPLFSPQAAPMVVPFYLFLSGEKDVAKNNIREYS